MPETSDDDGTLSRAKDEARNVLSQLGRIALAIRRSVRVRGCRGQTSCSHSRTTRSRRI